MAWVEREFLTFTLSWSTKYSPLKTEHFPELMPMCIDGRPLKLGSPLRQSDICFTPVGGLNICVGVVLFPMVYVCSRIDWLLASRPY